MSLYELEHPLGQDVEKVHQALIAGLADSTELFNDRMVIEFYDALFTGRGISVLKLASIATQNRVLMEFPVVIPDDDTSWFVDWGTGPEPVVCRFKAMDLLDRGFNLRLLESDGGNQVHTEFLRFDVTQAGVAVTFDRGEGKETHFGEFESEPYFRFTETALREASIGELAILSDAA